MNRSSRQRAIEESISPIIPELIDQLDSNEDVLNAFDFLAVRLFAEKKNAMWQLLDSLSMVDTNIVIRDKRYTTDQGIAAKVNCKKGGTAVVRILQQKFSESALLQDMICDFDGLNIKVYPKEQDKPVLNEQQKFTGSVVLTPDVTMITEKSLQSSPDFENNQTIMKDMLWQSMQPNYRLFDASDLWKNLQNESKVMQVFAASHPTDYIAKKNHLATHTVYYWATTEFKTQQQQYCFAKLGIRVIRMVTAETVAYYQLDSATEFKRGIMVTRDHQHARQEAIRLLVKRGINKITTLLAQEDNFNVYQPRIAIAAEGLSTEEINKLKDIFVELEEDGIIDIANDFFSGETFLRFEVSPSKDTTQTRLRQIVLEYAEADQFLIKIQTQVGKFLISSTKE